MTEIVFLYYFFKNLYIVTFLYLLFFAFYQKDGFITMNRL